MKKTSPRLANRRIRHARIRNKITGDASRPRLCVFRSARHIYAQVIDDAAGRTLVAASTMEKEIRGGGKPTGNRASATQVGKLLAERAVKEGVERVVFDRGGNRYHGRVKALAESAREAGLKF